MQTKICFLILFWVAPLAFAELTMSPGEPLREVLDRFTEVQLNVVSTAKVLPQTLVVQGVPDGVVDNLALIRALLAQHQLELVMVDANNGYVRKQPTTQTLQRTSVEAKDAANRLVEEIVVTSDYRLHRSLLTANTLDQHDLQSLPSIGRDTLRGLSLLPGVATSGISARHQLRGGDDNEVLYRFDGVELLEPFHLSSVQSLFSAVNINVVEAADVYLAGFPVAMGSRMSGVIDLVPIEVQAPFAGGIDINPVTASVDAGGQYQNWHWLGSVRRSVLQHSLSMFETDYGEPKFDDEFVRVSYDTDSRTVVFGLLRNSDEVDVQDATESGESSSKYQTVWLHLTQRHGERLRSIWRLNSTGVDFTRSGEVDIENFVQGELLERRDFRTLEIENEWQWRLSEALDVDAGWSVADQDGDFRSVFEADYGPLALPIQAASSLARDIRISRTGESMAAFVSVISELSNNLSVELGIRYDGQDIDPVHVNELSARLNIDYQPHPDWHLLLDVGRYTQQQHLYELQIDDGKLELDPPQHSDQINLAAIWQVSDDSRLRLDLYLREVDNPWSHAENLYNRWVLVPEVHGDRYQIEPSGARVRGFEAAYIYRPRPSLGVHLSYSYSRAEEYYLGKYRDRPWQQSHEFKGGIQWQSQKWRLALTALYRSGWPSTNFVAQNSDLSGQVFNTRLPNYLSVDAHIARRFPLARGVLEAYLDVTNLTARENVGGYDYAAGGRRGEQQLLPLAPILGVSWRW